MAKALLIALLLLLPGAPLPRETVSPPLLERILPAPSVPEMGAWRRFGRTRRRSIFRSSASSSATSSFLADIAELVLLLVVVYFFSLGPRNQSSNRP